MRLDALQVEQEEFAKRQVERRVRTVELRVVRPACLETDFTQREVF